MLCNFNHACVFALTLAPFGLADLTRAGVGLFASVPTVRATARVAESVTQHCSASASARSGCAHVAARPEPCHPADPPVL